MRRGTVQSAGPGRVPKERRKNYLMFEQTPDKRFTFGSDAITNSYTKWGKPRALVEAKAELSEEQKRRYFNPPYTIGSAMIWPVRKIHRPTLNTARGMRLRIADRMDLTLECIRRHYAEEPGSPLADVTTNYADFFELFCTFKQFVEFFHLQDLVTPEGKIDFFLEEDEESLQAPRRPDHEGRVRQGSGGLAEVHNAAGQPDGRLGREEPPRHQGPPAMNNVYTSP